MLVRTLRHLLDTGEYRRCLTEALALLQDEGLPPGERSRIYGLVCRSRLGLRDYGGAVKAGRRAVAEAERAGEPDLWGTAVVDTADALVKAHGHAEAVALLEAYLSKLDAFVGARCLEGLALMQLGRALSHLDRVETAQKRFMQALTWFERFGDLRSVYECRRLLIDLALRRGDLTLAGQMLVRQDDLLDDEMRCAYLLDMAAFCLAYGQHQRAIDAAFEAIELAEPDRLAEMADGHLLLARAALDLGAPTDACNFALAARVSAIEGRLYDQEFRATLLLIRVMEEHGAEVLTALEDQYQAQGVSLYHYLPADVLKHF